MLDIKIIVKKKVFFIMSTDDYSGAEAVNFSIINGLKQKYDFYWISKKGKINNFLEENKINWIEIEKLSVKEVKRVIRKYKPDILHATDFRASLVSSIAKGKIHLIEHLHHLVVKYLFLQRYYLLLLLFHYQNLLFLSLI